jgi:superfamily II RNA helicase
MSTCALKVMSLSQLSEQVHGPTELVTSSKRPVPLVWHFSTRSCLLPLLSDEGTGMNMDLHLSAQRQDSSPVNGHGRRHQKGFLWGELEQELSYDEIQILRRRQVGGMSFQSLDLVKSLKPLFPDQKLSGLIA